MLKSDERYSHSTHHSKHSLVTNLGSWPHSSRKLAKVMHCAPPSISIPSPAKVKLKWWLPSLFLGWKYSFYTPLLLEVSLEVVNLFLYICIYIYNYVCN